MDHLSSDVDNRIEYALWQQRQAHEKSLQELCALHAQELHEATVQVSNRPLLGQTMLSNRCRPEQPLHPLPAWCVPAAGHCVGDGQEWCSSKRTAVGNCCCTTLLPAAPALWQNPAVFPESCLHHV